PQPQRAAAVVTDAPRVVTLPDPAVDVVRRAVDGVAAAIDAGLQDVALVPHHVVAGPHRAAAQPVRLGARAERHVQPDRRTLVRVGTDPHLFPGPHHLDPRTGQPGRVRVVAVRALEPTQDRPAPDLAHLDRVDAPAPGI